MLTAPGDAGENRRLTILFADLVDSTVLSTRVEPETYRMLVGRYREQVVQVVDRVGGHVGSAKGDGLLVVFGLVGLMLALEAARGGGQRNAYSAGGRRGWGSPPIFLPPMGGGGR